MHVCISGTFQPVTDMNDTLQPVSDINTILTQSSEVFKLHLLGLNLHRLAPLETKHSCEMIQTSTIEALFTEVMTH